MKKRNATVSNNYLEKRPMHSLDITWTTDGSGNVTLEVENKGFLNRIVQIILHKPKVSYIHLDEMGSFVWPLIDGEKNIIELGKLVEAEFGEKATPLYERLAKFFQVLESYRFIMWK